MDFETKLKRIYQSNQCLENLGTPDFISRVRDALTDETKQYIVENDFSLRIYARILHDAMELSESPSEANAYFMERIQDQNYVIGLMREFGER